MSVRALIYVPSPDQEGLSGAERLAIRVRNAATITCVCACGARHESLNRAARRARRKKMPGEPFVERMPMFHEDDCPAISPLLADVARRFGDRLVYIYALAEFGEAA